jgi:hypothetical protein
MKRSPRQRNAPTKPRCVLDSGGLSGLLGRSARAREWVRWNVTHGGEIVIPTPILVECTTGHAERDAEVNRVLGVLERFGSVLRAPDEATARRAGSLRFVTRVRDAVDALVAAEAAGTAAPSVVLTSDPDDLKRLLTSAPEVVVERV